MAEAEGSDRSPPARSSLADHLFHDWDRIRERRERVWIAGRPHIVRLWSDAEWALLTAAERPTDAWRLDEIGRATVQPEDE
jgi:hypothetical protein